MIKYKFYLAETNGYNMIVAVDEKSNTAIYYHSDSSGKVWGIDIYNKDVAEVVRQLQAEVAEADDSSINEYADSYNARVKWDELQTAAEKLHKVT